MNYLLTIGIALIGTLASVFSIYNYLPLDILQFNKPEQTFGSTITTIAGTDTLSSSRTTINNNFSNLNSTKIENSTTSVAAITTLANLSTIGTIASGIWNGTAIGVGYGGTGTTSPTSNQVMLGNGASGFKVVSGFGSSGQFLTSNGAATAPTWQTSAVDQAANYTWTGLHTFNTGGIIATASSTFSGVLNTATTTSSTNVIGKGFGGTGADGALTCTTATTTISIGSAAVLEKNYSSISITGDCAIEFSNPATAGSIVIFKSQGNVTFTSSKQIYLVGLGATGGAGNTSPAGTGNAAGGGGGGSMTAVGVAGTNGGTQNDGGGTGTAGTASSIWLYTQTAVGGGGGGCGGGNPCAGGTAGASPTLNTTLAPTYLRWFVAPGGGGGGGGSRVATNGGDGARGGGALYMEVGGNLNITGTINASGAQSANTTAAAGGCGGGGGGGSIQIIYNYLTANSGTYTVAGGVSGGTCTATGGAGGAGYSSVTQNKSF